MKNFIRTSLLIAATVMIGSSCDDDDAGDHHHTEEPKAKYIVTFDSQGGSDVPQQEVEEEQFIEEPVEPTMEDYVFGGWYTEAEGTTAWDFNTPVKSDLTLFAKWTVEGVLINGVRWATSNVDTPGTFAASSEVAGKIYQWNKSTAWSATGGVLGWDNNVIPGLEWASFNDPSPEGWRVPTGDELQTLVDEDKVSSEWTTVNGVVGREYGSGANTIFLPAAGRWSAKQDKKIDVGENGFYWTSTRVGAGSAHDLLFNEGFSGHQQGHGMDGGGVIQRRNGLSVRCVKQ